MINRNMINQREFFQSSSQRSSPPHSAAITPSRSVDSTTLFLSECVLITEHWCLCLPLQVIWQKKQSEEHQHVLVIQQIEIDSCSNHVPVQAWRRYLWYNTHGVSIFLTVTRLNKPLSHRVFPAWWTIPCVHVYVHITSSRRMAPNPIKHCVDSPQEGTVCSCLLPFLSNKPFYQ